MDDTKRSPLTDSRRTILHLIAIQVGASLALLLGHFAAVVWNRLTHGRTAVASGRLMSSRSGGGSVRVGPQTMVPGQ
jgi:hypothetical protein